MRAGAAIALSVASMALGASLVACFDLFHATDDVLTACQLDAQAPGCGGDGGADAGAAAGTDFCAWGHAEALRAAQHACAWLGACETPMGRNAYGACMFEALLAYDCAANPSHPLTLGSDRHALWDCLSKVQTCGDVDTCVFPSGPPTCGPGVGTACGNGDPDASNDLAVRIECANGGKGHGENCTLWGQQCASAPGSPAYCAGAPGSAGLSCNANDTCAGGRIHSCAGGRDVGIDCSPSGAGKCDGFPTEQAASWVACVPRPDAGSPCTPALGVTCANGVASSCPTGVTETIDCATLLDDVRGCTPGQLSPTWDWTSACFVSAADAGAGDSGADGGCETCTGTSLSSCTRGASYSVDCTSVGLGPCKMVTTDLGQQSRAACTAP